MESREENKKPIPFLRWWVGILLFFVTVINYIDRQTLSALSPILRDQYKWQNADYAFILNAFRVSYTVMQAICGRLLDWIGTRKGIALSVVFYSAVGALTSLAQGFRSFVTFRFLLGAGEATNNPGGAKVVSEWFPARERAWAVALYNSGCSVGGAIAPFIVLFIYHTTGSWRPAFLVTGSLGALWLIAWLWLYHTPEKHSRISKEELEYIRAGRSSAPVDTAAVKLSWLQLLRYPQTWGLILGRFLLDPFWFLIAEWYGLYLNSKGFTLSQSVLGFWAPFLGAAAGNFFAGGLSSFWVSRGWPVGRSRRVVLLFFGPSMLLLSLATASNNYFFLLSIFAYASFAYACCGTMFLTLPTDVFHTRAVGTVMGLAGTSAGIGTLISTFYIGRITDLFSMKPCVAAAVGQMKATVAAAGFPDASIPTDAMAGLFSALQVAERFSYAPVIIAASIIPCVATIFFVTLVRRGKKPDPAGILLDF